MVHSLLAAATKVAQVCQTLYNRRGVCTFKSPKTSGSSRRVAMTPKLALFLKGHKAERESL